MWPTVAWPKPLQNVVRPTSPDGSWSTTRPVWSAHSSRRIPCCTPGRHLRRPSATDAVSVLSTTGLSRSSCGSWAWTHGWFTPRASGLRTDGIGRWATHGFGCDLMARSGTSAPDPWTTSPVACTSCRSVQSASSTGSLVSSRRRVHSERHWRRSHVPGFLGGHGPPGLSILVRSADDFPREWTTTSRERRLSARSQHHVVCRWARFQRNVLPAWLAPPLGVGQACRVGR